MNSLSTEPEVDFADTAALPRLEDPAQELLPKFDDDSYSAPGGYEYPEDIAKKLQIKTESRVFMDVYKKLLYNSRRRR